MSHHHLAERPDAQDCDTVNTAIPPWSREPITDTAFLEEVADCVARSNIPLQYKQALHDLLLEFSPQFRDTSENTLPMDVQPYVIHTTHDAPVGFRGTRRYPRPQLDFICSEALKLVAMDVLERSTSLYNNPPVVVIKADGRGSLSASRTTSER